MYINNHYRQQEVYLSFSQPVRFFPFWNIGFSVDFQWNKLNADLYDFVYPQRIPPWSLQRLPSRPTAF
jgi:hypothetical protein